MKITITKNSWKDRMRAKTGKPVHDKLPEINDQIQSEMFKYPLYSDKDLQITKQSPDVPPKATSSERAQASEGEKPKEKPADSK